MLYSLLAKSIFCELFVWLYHRIDHISYYVVDFVKLHVSDIGDALPTDIADIGEFENGNTNFHSFVAGVLPIVFAVSLLGVKAEYVFIVYTCLSEPRCYHRYDWPPRILLRNGAV